MNRSVDYHFLTAVAVFCIYGIHVCPFLESLSVLELTLPVVFVMLVVYLVVKRLAPGMSFSQGDECVRSAQYWQWVFCAFVAASIALVIYNSLSYDYPIDSALKVLLGLSTLGFFIATDLTLIFEREQAQRLGAMGVHLTPPTQFMPMTRKFTLFAGINALCMAGVIFLVVQKDLLWLLGDGQSVTLEQARWVILFEVAFVAVVVLGYTIKVIRSYSSNLAFFFNNENHALKKVAQGDLTVRTPVASQDEFGVMAHHTNLMIQDLQQATEEVKQTRDVAILGLSSLAEARDNETGAHILRTQYYVKALAEYLSSQPGFAEYLDQQTIELMHKSAPLHDVGKVGIPDAILLKPGKLTDDEFAIMKQHPEIGAQAIANAES